MRFSGTCHIREIAANERVLHRRIGASDYTSQENGAGKGQDVGILP